MGKKLAKDPFEDLLKKQLDLISYEYSIDIFEQGIVKVYLTTSVYATYEIIINFKNYPKKPEIKYDNSLELILGTPESSLHIIKKWDENQPENIVEIIHEIEGLVISSSVLDEIGLQLSYRYYTIALGPKRVKIVIEYENDKHFDFDIFYEKSPPEVKLSENASKFIKISQIKSLNNWNENSSIIALVDEIAQKLEHRLRIFYELKEIQPYVNGLVQSGAKITFNVYLKIETGEFFEFEFILRGRYPKSPPEITLISRLNDQLLLDKISDFISYQIEYWDKNKRLRSIIEELKELLLKNSDKVCKLCHKFKCPTCQKQIVSNIEGVSGMNECKHVCPFCGSKFHMHCWNEVYKLTHQCPICLKNIKRI
ncbi:MAG: hypothetical protein ACTSPY_17325 [Candidatus Helarchaeota archaeon]